MWTVFMLMTSQMTVEKERLKLVKDIAHSLNHPLKHYTYQTTEVCTEYTDRWKEMNSSDE